MNLISNKLYKEIEQYCILNKIEDIPKEINNILQVGFNVVRFGMSPFQRPKDQEVLEAKEGVESQKKRGRKPKVVEIEKENIIIEDKVVMEQPKKKVRIIKNK